jgi:hypothetical protein
VFEHDAVVGGVEGALEAHVYHVDVFVVNFGVLHHDDEGSKGFGVAAEEVESLKFEIEIVYNMYRMRRFTPNTVCAGCCLSPPPTMPYMELTSQG